MSLSPRSSDSVKSFISSFIARGEREKFDKNNDRSNENGTSAKAIKEQAQLRVRESFQKRINTYKQLSWCAKPLWLSPPSCACYGWINVGSDLLQCVSCKAFLSGKMPSCSLDPRVYSACCQRLADSLRTSHKPLCPWISYPCDESLLGPPLGSQVDMQLEVSQRIKAIKSVGDLEPLLDQDAFVNMDLTMEDLQSLTTLLDCCLENDTRDTAGSPGRGDHCCEDEASGSQELMDVSGIGTTLSREQMTTLIAVCGWNKSPGNIPQLHCDFCDRRVGLWNFHSYHSVAHPAIEEETDDVENEKRNHVEKGDDGGNVRTGDEGEMNESPQNPTIPKSSQSSSDELDINSMVTDVLLQMVDSVIDQISGAEDYGHIKDVAEAQVENSQDQNIDPENCTGMDCFSKSHNNEDGGGMDVESSHCANQIAAEIIQELITKTFNSCENKEVDSIHSQSLPSPCTGISDDAEHVSGCLSDKDVEKKLEDVTENIIPKESSINTETMSIATADPMQTDLVTLGESNVGNSASIDPENQQVSAEDNNLRESVSTALSLSQSESNAEGELSAENIPPVDPESNQRFNPDVEQVQCKPAEKDDNQVVDVSDNVDDCKETKAEEVAIDAEQSSIASTTETLYVKNMPNEGSSLTDVSDRMSDVEESSKEIPSGGSVEALAQPGPEETTDIIAIRSVPDENQVSDDASSGGMNYERSSIKEVIVADDDGSVDYSPVASIVSDIESDEVNIVPGDVSNCDDEEDRISVPEFDVYYMSSSEEECDVMDKEIEVKAKGNADCALEITDDPLEVKASQYENDTTDQQDVGISEATSFGRSLGSDSTTGLISTAKEQGAGDCLTQTTESSKKVEDQINLEKDIMQHETVKDEPFETIHPEETIEESSLKEDAEMIEKESVIVDVPAEVCEDVCVDDVEKSITKQLNEDKSVLDDDEQSQTEQEMEVEEPGVEPSEISDSTGNTQQETNMPEESTCCTSIEPKDFDQKDISSEQQDTGDNAKPSESSIDEEEQTNSIVENEKCPKRKLSETQDESQTVEETSARDIQEPAPKKRKRPKILLTYFSPLKEHRSWCPWVSTSAELSYNQKEQTKLCQRPGWKKLVDILLMKKTPEKSLSVPLTKTTPPHVALRNIRHLLNQWTAQDS